MHFHPIYENMSSQVIDHADSRFLAEKPSPRPLPIGEEVREVLAAYTVDLEAGAVYFRLGVRNIKKTLETRAKVLVDVDDSGNAVGVEILINDPRALKAFENLIRSKWL